MNCEPVVGVPEAMLYAKLHVVPAVIAAGYAPLVNVHTLVGCVPPKVKVFVVPAKVMVALRTLVLAVPVLLKLTVHVFAAAWQDAVAVT